MAMNELIKKLNDLREKREKVIQNTSRYILEENVACEGHGIFYGTGKYHVTKIYDTVPSLDKEIKKLEKKLMNLRKRG
jgi:hypothetical protein